MLFFANRKDGQFEMLSAHEVDTASIEACVDKTLTVRKNKTVSYIETFGTFDIETTSYRDEHLDTHVGFMYIWMFTVGTYTVYGRKWAEFILWLRHVVKRLRLSDNCRFVIYVHNLGFEFQFMREALEELGEYEVFAMKSRRPLVVRMECGIEFRCSYFLSNMSLEMATKTEYGCQYVKAAGDLDYKAYRTPETTLSDVEYGYVFNDTLSLWHYVKAKMVNEGDNIATIPLTSTGYVRRECRKACKADKNYMNTYFRCSLTKDVYTMLKEASRGGDTSSNWRLTNQLLKGCDSYDAQSSYPFQLCTQLFPVSRFYYYTDRMDENDLESLIKEGRAVLFRCLFINLSVRPETVDNYLPFSKKIEYAGKYRLSNGRILKAELIQYTFTDIDWVLVKKDYQWEKAVITDVYTAQYGHIPKALRGTIIQYFTEKSTLKYKLERDISEDDDSYDITAYLYAKSKNRINGIFGMTFTDPVRDVIDYLGVGLPNDWETHEASVEEELKKYEKHTNSFLVYAWGVWTTAHARQHLHWLIDLSGEGCAYWDTDCTKGINFDEAKINEANKSIMALSEKMGAYADVKGMRYYMGVFEKETSKGQYQYFKTLGAKKYAYVQHDGTLKCTISGVSKKYGAQELETIDNFKRGFVFHKSAGIELIYNDYRQKPHLLPDGTVMDIGPNIGTYDSTYKIGISKEFCEVLGIDWEDV